MTLYNIGICFRDSRSGQLYSAQTFISSRLYFKISLKMINGTPTSRFTQRFDRKTEFNLIRITKETIS